jgi:uncharacterized Fe-S cluster-containing radical SAM superfamily protein
VGYELNGLDGKYSNVMRGAYWYNQCRPFFRWGYDPCQSKQCYRDCAVMCERSHEFKRPGFVLHYHGCNLDCRFCWAYNVRNKPNITVTSREVISQLLCKLNVLNNDEFIAKSKINPTDICTIRLTGNEPTLQWAHIMELFEILNDEKRVLEIQQSIAERLPNSDISLSKQIQRLKVLTQTNAVEIGKPASEINIEELSKFKNLDLNFEVSFKGVNQDQFAWLANSAMELFEYQCIGFEKLWKSQNENLHVTAELKINHCANIKKHPELGVRIIDQKAQPLDFDNSAKMFKDRVLALTELDYEENSFQEFGEINKERARSAIQTYEKASGRSKNCLPSEFY